MGKTAGKTNILLCDGYQWVYVRRIQRKLNVMKPGVMVVQLRRVTVHDLLRILKSIGAMKLRSVLVQLFIGMIINVEIFDIAFPSYALVELEARSKLFVSTNLY